jgi:hypothetical protein
MSLSQNRCQYHQATYAKVFDAGALQAPLKCYPADERLRKCVPTCQ